MSESRGSLLYKRVYIETHNAIVCVALLLGTITNTCILAIVFYKKFLEPITFVIVLGKDVVRRRRRRYYHNLSFVFVTADDF